jgi:ABC-type transport system involved in cytochrome c biogenesis permease component
MNINPAALSKINWTNGIAFLVAVAAVFHVAIPQDVQDSVLKAIAVGVPIVTMILRTFFTAKTSD